MKFLATKRIFAMFIALAMVVAPLTVNVLAEEPVIMANSAEQDIVRPDLTMLENPVAPPSMARGSAVQIVDSGEFDYTRGIDFDLTGVNISPPTSLRQNKSIQSALPGNQYYDFYTTTGVKRLWAYAETAHCVVFVDKDLGAASTLFAQEADAIANKFEEIYNMESSPSSASYVGKPMYWGGEEKVWIALYDIDDDGNSSAGFTAGYFSPNDYFNNATSNGMMVVNIDIGANQGYSMYTHSDPTYRAEWYGTMAHEYQHLLHFGNYIESLSANNLSFDPNDPDLSFNYLTSGSTKVAIPTIWSNEGMSGAVDTLYSGAMTRDHRDLFLLSDFKYGTGYIPTYEEWYDTNNQVYANYGAASLIMSEYYQYGAKKFNPYVTDGRVGYIKGNEKTGDLFWNGANNFDAFFTLAVLDIAVDTPDSTYAAIAADNSVQAYINTTIDNMWQARKDAVTSGYNNPVKWSDKFAGVTDITAGQQVNVVNNDAKYFSTLYLAEPTGQAGKVSIDIPSSSAEYYVIYPYNTTNINTDTLWIGAGKVAKKLTNGSANDVTVGSNNHFAIAVINHNNTISDTFSYNPASISVSNVTLIPEIPMQGEPATGTFSGNAEASSVDISVVDADDNVAVGITTNAATLTVTNNEFNGTFDVSDTAFTGAYRIKATDGTDTAYSRAFYISVKASLVSPADGGTAPVTTDSITLGFSAQVKASTGRIILFDNNIGIEYTATAEDDELTDAVTIPLSSFKDDSGASPSFFYGDNYLVEIEENAVVDENDTPNAHQDLGGFTIESQPADPSVLPLGKITIPKGESKDIRVYFGSANAGNISSATITSPDESLVTISDPATITSEGTFTLNGVEATDAPIKLSIGFSSATPVGSLEVEVEVTGEKNPVYYPEFDSSSSSDGGGNGGGGGGGGQPQNIIVDTAMALRFAQPAINKAVAAGKDTATVNFTNVAGFTKESLKAMADAAKKAGVKLIVNVNTVVNGKVILRITFNPAEATKGIKTGGSLTSTAAKNVTKKFNSAFPSNNISVLALTQQGDFGMTVHIAVLADISKLDDSKLRHASYDGDANRFEILGNTNTFVDKNGYTHFDTKLAGAIITTDKAFTK